MNTEMTSRRERRTSTATVLVTDGVKHQPLTGIKADSKAPFLPAHLVAVDLKAGAFRLSDLKRPQVAARARVVRDVLRGLHPGDRVLTRAGRVDDPVVL